MTEITVSADKVYVLMWYFIEKNPMVTEIET